MGAGSTEAREPDPRYNETLGGQMDAATRSIRANCDDIVDNLPIPRPFTLDRFVRELGDRRGRLIELVPARLGATAPCGLLVSTDDIDYVCYAENTSPLHRWHIIFHELGHLELDHEGPRVTLPPDDPQARLDTGLNGAVPEHSDPVAALRLLLPDLSPTLIRRLLSRTSYHAEEERPAELFATLTAARVNRVIGLPHLATPRDMEMDLVRLRSIFDVPVQRSDSRG